MRRRGAETGETRTRTRQLPVVRMVPGRAAGGGASSLGSFGSTHGRCLWGGYGAGRGVRGVVAGVRNRLFAVAQPACVLVGMRGSLWERRALWWDASCCSMFGRIRASDERGKRSWLDRGATEK